jgi:hypothetical protein
VVVRLRELAACKLIVRAEIVFVIVLALHMLGH